jgi:hypothetical protein
MDEREKITPGTNDRSVDETIAGTGPGIPDDSLAPSEDELPEPRVTMTSSGSGKSSAHLKRKRTRFRWKANS